MRLLLVILILFSPVSAAAQEYSFEQHANYTRLSLQALKMPKYFDFNIFRAIYTQTEQFNPIGDDVETSMLEYAHTAEKDINPERRRRALRSYQTLVTKHLANLDVVLLAHSLSRENPALGNPRVFKWLRRGLMEAVKTSGDGQSLNRAYNIITPGEETALLRELRVQVLKTDFHHEGAEYYNVHHVKGTAGKVHDIYVDVSIPLKILADRKETARQALQLPAQ